MRARQTHRQKVRLSTGVLAVALLAPAAEPAFADAVDPGEEQEIDREGTTDPSPGGDAGTGDLTPGYGTTGDVVETNDPPLVAPGDTSDPADGENEDGPVETEEPPIGDDVDPPAPTLAPAPPAAAPAPPSAPAAPPADPAPPSNLPAESVPAPPVRVAPLRRAGKPNDRSPRRIASKPKQRARVPVRAPSFGSKPSPPTKSTPSPANAEHSPPAPRIAAAKSVEGPTRTVQPGDTLWAIAAAQLGVRASPAQIAREVQRLWDLNARAIGTGDPSLLGVGVELRLR